MNIVVSTSIAETLPKVLIRAGGIKIQVLKFEVDILNICLEEILHVRLTVTTASKKKGLKKLVACPITFSRIVGRYTVNSVPRSLRPKVIEVLNPLPFLFSPMEYLWT